VPRAGGDVPLTLLPPRAKKREKGEKKAIDSHETTAYFLSLSTLSPFQRARTAMSRGGGRKRNPRKKKEKRGERRRPCRLVIDENIPIVLPPAAGKRRGGTHRRKKKGGRRVRIPAFAFSNCEPTSMRAFDRVRFGKDKIRGKKATGKKKKEGRETTLPPTRFHPQHSLLLPRLS